jgi:hypothetical protein
MFVLMAVAVVAVFKQFQIASAEETRFAASESDRDAANARMFKTLSMLEKLIPFAAEPLKVKAHEIANEIFKLLESHPMPAFVKPEDLETDIISRFQVLYELNTEFNAHFEQRLSS